MRRSGESRVWREDVSLLERVLLQRAQPCDLSTSRRVVHRAAALCTLLSVGQVSYITPNMDAAPSIVNEPTTQ
jgi:hypothetical protein